MINHHLINLRDQCRGFHNTATWSKLLDGAGGVQRPRSPENKNIKNCRSLNEL